MTEFVSFGERYDSFNVPRQLLKLYENDKEKLSSAYSFCVNQAKQKNNQILYKNLIDEANSKGIKLDSSADYDLEWVQKKEQEFRQEFLKKESELKLHISNNIKPSIQMSYLELARLFIKAGDLKDFEQYATKAHEVQPSNSEANYYYKISLLLNHKFDEIKKITDNEIEQDTYKNMAAELRTAYLHGRVIAGITKLRSKDLHGALNIFSEINPDFISDIGIYSSLHDLARYVAVLGIICHRREEIYSRVFGENTKHLIQNNQVAVKLVESFVNANYEETSKALQKIMDEWHLDSYVENVKSIIHGLLMDKIIKQYLSTVSRVSLPVLAETFNLSNSDCEDLIRNLILSNKIAFRIDKLQNILLHQEESAHSQAKLVKKAVGMIGNYCFEKQFAVMKVSYSSLNSNRPKGKGLVDTFLE